MGYLWYIIGHMKKFVGMLIALGYILGSGVGLAKANEGSLSFVNGSISCDGVSLWKESGYRVSASCRGLVYPYETQYEHYVAWVKLDKGDVLRIGEVERGYFEGNVSESFQKIVITAEKEGLPRRASTKEVITGDVKPFNQEITNQTVLPQVTPVPVENAGATMTVQNSLPDNANSGVTVGSVIGKILKSLLLIIGVIILMAVGASLVFRRRGSVSA